MENNNQNANWQEAINEMSQTASEQVNQTVENVQQAVQPAPEQPAQPVQAGANGWFTAPDNQNVYDAGDFAVLPAKKKSNKTLIIVLVIVAAAILIGGGIFLLLTMNKSSGYEALEKKYFANLSEQFDSVSEQTKAGVEMNFVLTPGAAMTGGMEVAPSTLKAKIHADADALTAYTEMTYLAGDTDIATIKYWMDNETFYFQIPELSDVIIKTDAETTSSLTGSLGSMGTVPMMEDETITTLPSNPTDMLAGYTEILQNIDDETFEKVFAVLADAYFETAKNCTKTSTGTLQCGEVSMNCDINTITFTGKDVMDFVLILLNKAEADAEIMELLSEFGVDKAMLSSAKTYVEEATKEMPEEDAKKVLFTMTVYSKGDEIVGRVIDIDGDEIRFITVNDGGKFATEIAMETEGEEVVKFVANGTVTDDKYDGTFELASENSTGLTGSLSLTLNDYVNGSVTISGDSDGVKQDLTFTIASSEKHFSIGMDLISGGASMMKLDLEMNEIAYEAPTMPSGTTADMTNPEDPNYVKFTTDVTNNITTLMTKLSSLDKPDIVAALLTSFGSGMDVA